MLICITGGSGFVGRAVIEHARRAGHSTVVLTRQAQGVPTPAPAPSPAACGARIPVDYGDTASLQRAMSGADALIHLVGIISEAREQTFERAHVTTTSSVLEAARRSGIQRIVHMSALGTRPAARSRYHQTKWAAEELVRTSGLQWTILRPSLIYGPEDHFTNLFARIARWSPFLPVMGAGKALLQPIGVHTVASAFVRALTCPNAASRVLDLCGPLRLTFPELLRLILAASGRSRGIIRIPMGVARCQARAMELVMGRVLGFPPPLNRDQLLMLEEDNVGDGSEADMMFGLVHPDLAEALRRQFTAG